MYLYFKSLLSRLIYKVLVKLIEAKSVSSSGPLRYAPTLHMS